MANFTNSDIMKLREQTGVGMMDCKKALVETDGNFEEAVKFLREKGMASAAKKASRVAAEGLVACVVADDNSVGVAVEVNCETDFVARSEPFVALVDTVAKQILSRNVATVEELLAIEEISNLTAEATASIGEKISIRRFSKFALTGAGVVDSYIHMGGKIGVLVELASEATDKATLLELIHNCAMQIAAAKPSVVRIDEVDASVLDNEKEILTAQARNEGKPEAIITKMVEGRIKNFYKAECLLEQEYVRDPSLTIKQVVAQCEQKVGAKIELVKFTRFEMGEGLEKRVDNFVEEIAEQMNSIK